MRIHILLAALLCASVSTTAYAVAEAQLVLVTPTNSFTVPEGKVLQIENLKLGWDGVVLSKGNQSLTLTTDNFPSSNMGPYIQIGPYIQFPLRIPAGWKLSTVTIQPQSSYWVFALLVDETDLYAAIQNKLENAAVAGGLLSMDVRTSSPRPVRVVVEKAPEPAKVWEVASEASVSRTADKTKHVASLPAAGDTGFVRAKVLPIAR
jgi:hypothetical protein